MKNKTLFNSVTRHGVNFSNAIVMAPMTRSRAIGTVPNDLMVKYYTQRSAAGLIVTEGIAPSKHGLGYARTPGIFTPGQIEGWKNVTKAVHAKGSVIFAQIMHVGRVANEANTPEGARIMAPSSVPAVGEIWTDANGLQPKGHPQAMSVSEIGETISDYVKAAENAIEAGFDGIEIHGANGYLPEQFLNPGTNIRTDAYGGSVKNRARFILEVAAAIANAIGKEKVGVRVSPYSSFNDMPIYEEVFETYSYIASELSKLDVLYIHLVDYAARQSEEGLKLIGTIRTNFRNLLILNGGYTKERAERSLQTEGADMISFGSPFISNPDLPYRLEHGIPLNSANPDTFYSPGEEGYTNYPFAGQVVLSR